MPNETAEQCQGFLAFHEQVNIGLYNDIVAFVMATTAADTKQVYRNLTDNHLWYCRSHNDNIQEQYGFRYFGELLERFEDRAGSDISDIRAIALAMADTKDLFTDDMFVGNQKNNFIKKITRLSVGDIYLKSALYLLKKDDANSDELLELLTRSAYNRTEELIFVMSLYDEFEQAFLTCKPWIYKLLCKTRTMPAAGNIEIYCWLIKRLRYCSKLKEIRTKDMALFRALMELPVSFVKKGNKHHTVLLENGYTAEEIVYLNSAVICLRPTSDTIYKDSIVAEKIAVEMCITFINSENTHLPDVYEHLEWLLKTHKQFNIKINGYQGIYQAIENEINIKNAQTFIWLYKQIEPKDVFRFDILDEKWDVLSRELEADAYRKLVEKQLIENSEFTKEQITERIEKYDKLTGTSYFSQFEREFEYDKNDDFALLVNKGILDLATAFTSCLETNSTNDMENGRPNMLIYIGKYIQGIHNRESFEFIKYFLSKCDFNDMHRFFIDKPDRYGYSYIDHFFVDEFYKGPARYYRDDKNQRFEIKRSFLTDDEHRELFGWLDDYMLQFKAEKYTEFAVHMIIDSFVSTLFPHNELREIYDRVYELDIKVVQENIQELKNRYMTEAERQAEKDAETARKSEEKRLEHERQIQNLKDGFTAVYDGSFKSLLKFLDNYRYEHQNQKEAIKMAVEYLYITLSGKNHVLPKEELGRFLQLSGRLLKDGHIDFDTLKEHISMIKEEPENVEDSCTP